MNYRFSNIIYIFYCIWSKNINIFWIYMYIYKFSEFQFYKYKFQFQNIKCIYENIIIYYIEIQLYIDYIKYKKYISKYD